MCQPSKLFDLKLGKGNTMAKASERIRPRRGKDQTATGKYPGMDRP